MRFPEFTGEWKETTLGKIGGTFNGLTGKSGSDFGQGCPYITYKSIFDNSRVDINRVDYVTISDEERRKESQNKVLYGDIFFTTSSETPDEVGMTSVLLDKIEDCYLNSFCFGYRLFCQENYLPEYLRFYFRSRVIRRKLSILAQGSTRFNISKKEVMRLGVKVPNSTEQRKIANFLTLLDERIATQNKIIEDLKKLKSAIIDEVFCSPEQHEPKRRFEGCSVPLSTYKMKDFCFRITDKNRDNKCLQVLTIAAQYGLVDQESFFNKSVASENLTGYYILKKGDFAYNRSYSSGYAWGTVKRLNNYSKGVLSTLYICFRVDESVVNSDYLSYYFESTKWHKGVSDISGEGARNHGLLNISVTDYFNTKHHFAVIAEQKRIASMLNAITIKEQNAIELGKLYSKHKQYLLRQMFI